MGLGDYIWTARINEFFDKVCEDIYYNDDLDTKTYKKSINKHYLLDRIRAVGETVDESLTYYELRDYIIENEKLFSKLYEAEFPGKKIFW
jgi:hypothetical protein